jgi:hypothetical protein
MKKLIATAIVGAACVLMLEDVVHSGENPLNVDAICPASLIRSTSNRITVKVSNKSDLPQTIEHFAVSYVGNTPEAGPVIAGPFVRTLAPPVILAPGGSLTRPLSFPAVPVIYPLNTVISPVVVVFTHDGGAGNGGILGNGNCLAPVRP